MEQNSARLAEGSATPPPPGLQPSGRPAADSAAADAHAPMVFSASTFEPRAAWACAVQPAAESLQADREVVLAAVEQDGTALRA